jgi:ribose transport system permease protein
VTAVSTGTTGTTTADGTAPEDTATDAAAAARSEAPRPGLLRLLNPTRCSAIYLWLAFMVVFSFANDQFLTSTTTRLVFNEGVVTAILALAFLVPMIGGAFDLSIGAVMGLALVITNWIGIETSLPAGVGVVVALAACAVVGAVSGFVVVKLKVHSFVATLGVSQLITGIVILVSDNRQMTGAFSDTYKEYARGDVFGVPVLVVYLLVLAAIVWFVLEQTPLGRRLYATGGNADAARLAGVRTDRIMWTSLVVSASMAGLAGVLFSMKVGTFSSSIGSGYLFPAVAAVFFGASQFSGRPNVWGTVVAYYALAFGIKGLQLVAGPGTVWIGPVFEGTALVLAVALASQKGVLRARRLARAENGSLATTPAPVTTTGGDA